MSNTVYTTLNTLAIPYQEHKHKAVFTVAESLKHCADIPGGHTKNLFVRNKKGDKHYLVIVEHTKRVQFRVLEKELGEKNVSFASPERLMKFLGLTPGSVSAFGLINDSEKHVTVVIDAELLACDTINFHPNINTATLTIRTEDFRKFLQWSGNEVRICEL